ncbi:MULTISPECIES: 6-phospho-3-hexuloisomerase [Aerococcus]|nr:MULTISPECIES: 6-phospho-3-hexuloisomerase [Aerococcus]MDL5175615.1 6-phospho-3-hexuloisomerase [Aerococcus mictus]
MTNSTYRNYVSILKELNMHQEELALYNFGKINNLIINANHIFLLGAGRSGCVMKMFANRLNHLGLNVSIIGEVTAPPANKNDVLILNSSSGATDRLIVTAKKAKKIGVTIILISSQTNTELYKLADEAIIFSANSKSSADNSLSRQPMGSLFEQTSLIICDAIVISLKEMLEETNQTMSKRHANLE